MLGMRTYDPAYVGACRRHIETATVALDSLMGAARGDTNGAEATLLNNLVIVLDAQFVHRLRVVEGKDGNPLNEVRLLAASLLTNNGRMLADKQIKLDSASSVLGHGVGDEIQLRPAEFTRLAAAYFAEIERRFTSPTSRRPSPHCSRPARPRRTTSATSAAESSSPVSSTLTGT